MRYSNNPVEVGDITNATGVAIGSGAQASVTQMRNGTSDEVACAFAALRQRVHALPRGPVQAVAKSAIDVLEVEAAKGDRAKESNVSRWLDFLAQAAPDVWEAAVDAFLNPITGLGTAFKKIVGQAKAEREAKRHDRS